MVKEENNLQISQYLMYKTILFSVDLVTLDDLSAEAMLESSQRVEQLADLFRRRVEALPDPGPPQTLPGKPRTAIVPIQIVAIILYDCLHILYYF